jgi:hypothetical protein
MALIGSAELAQREDFIRYPPRRASVVPMNVLMKSSEVFYYLECSDAIALVAWRASWRRGEGFRAGAEVDVLDRHHGGAGRLEGVNHGCDLGGGDDEGSRLLRYTSLEHESLSTSARHYTRGKQI